MEEPVPESSAPAAPHFISNRLALVIPPARPKNVKPRAKKRMPRRTISALKNFLDLPLDIIYETFAYLEPLDMLTLARLSKDFRALFMSRSSLSIWRRVLKDTPDLPLCPQDLSEPQYASLMFDRHCMACGSTRGIIQVDFKTRLRFCATCARANLVRGYSIRTHDDMAQLRVAATIIPYSSSDSGSDDITDDYSSVENSVHLHYFKPELEHAIRELRERSPSKEAYEQFLAEQQAVATRMIKEGAAMQGYKDDLTYAKEEAAEAVADRRYQRILEEMVKLGWDTESYAPEYGEDDHAKWEEYLFQPKEFTARSWRIIQPKLAAIYQHTRRSRLTEDLIRRSWGEYIQFREGQEPEVRRTLPPWADVCGYSFLADFCIANYEECSEEQMAALMVQIVGASAGFAMRVEHELAHVIERSDETQKVLCGDDPGNCTAPPSSHSSARSETSSAVARAEKGKGRADAHPPRPPKDILARAASVFLCQCYVCSEKRAGATRVFGFPDIVNHVVDNATIARTWTQLRPQTRADGINAARDVLAALGLSEDCSREGVLALGEFVCGCGHYRFEGPLSFDRLVTHVYEQQMWNRRIERDVDPESEHLMDELVVDGHSRDRLKELVSIAPAPECKGATGTAASSGGTAIEDAGDAGEAAESDIPPGMYCRHCYRLELEGHIVRNEMMAYHLKYRHGRELAVEEEDEDPDFEELGELADQYGEKEEDDDMFFFPFPFPFF